MSVGELNASIEGAVQAVPPSWTGEDNGWNASIADTYYWTQPPGMFESHKPSYTVTVKSEADIKTALRFASENKMTVSVKNNGHSYFGAGYGGQLLIYTGELNSSKVHTNKTYCEAQHDSMEAGGGSQFLDVYKAVGDNYTMVGGACPSVGAGGGWILGNGLANEALPMYGLGIDQVLQYDIVLADGRHVQANECTNPELFKALRGGGGGFGVVTSVHYKLNPPTPMQNYQWTPCNANSTDPSNPNTTKRWDLLIRWAGKWDKRWSTKYISCAAIYTFLGTDEEAQASEFYKDATSLFGSPKHTSWNSVIDFKLHDGGSNWPWYKMASVPRQLSSTFEGNWLIPLDYLIEKPEEARNTFINMSASGALCAIHGEYLLLGLNNEINATNDPTSVLPATRKAAFQFTICDEYTMDKLKTMFPESGQGINHAAPYIQNWQDELWGPSYPFLLSMKKKVDPRGLFQCAQCVGSELVW